MKKKLSASSLLILHSLFFFSGVAALIYQLMWQRMLFNLFGVDLESITIIVSVFMFGLGIGGLWGGYLADKIPSRLLLMYVLIEFAIAIFGFFSPSLIDGIGNLPFSSSRWLTFLNSFLVLSCPTALMGATFPVLVKHVNKIKQNIGYSVGGLYFSNTLGGAAGAMFSGFILLHFFNLKGAINNAVIINLVIALIAILAFRGEE